MQDRGSAVELLDAIGRFLRKQSETQTDRWLRFQLLVASNSLAIVKRELEQEEGYLREEWAMLDGLLGEASMPPTFAELQPAMRSRQDALCERISAGAFDDPAAEASLLRFLVTETTNRVRISAPAELDPL
ncbi:MAG: DUF6285 domain-containing protein [Dehalococcoidia bacterium]